MVNLDIEDLLFGYSLMKQGPSWGKQLGLFEEFLVESSITCFINGRMAPKHSMRKLKLLIYICFILVILLTGFGPQPFAEERETAEVKTSSGGLVSRVAPGEFLPISVRLVNFGEGKRVDVTIDYQILDSSNTVVVAQSETVAVETTAGFVKIIQIPHDLPSGRYTAVSKITYEGQKVPAVSEYQFNVEKKVVGIFLSQFIIYGSLTLLMSIAFAVASRLIIKRRRASRLTPYEYPNAPKHDRLFYELTSDTIMQMRYRVGEKAIALARNIDGLSIDENGRVLRISKNPARIIALLILRYENQLGEKISFALRKVDKKTKERLVPVDKNLVIVRKYFE